MNKVDTIVDQKGKFLNSIFKIIDVTTDKISILTDKTVDIIMNFLKKIFKEN